MGISLVQVAAEMGAPRIERVTPVEGKRLLVKFVNGVEKTYDCTQLLHLEAFRPLKDDAFFKTVQVDTGGYGVSWNDDVDLSECELWVNGKELTSAP